MVGCARNNATRVWVKRFEIMEFLKNIEAVILAGGDYPIAQTPLAILSSASYVVCCDGATNEYIARGNRPDAIVGDGDSISAANREKYASILHVINEQESNDQTKAVRFLMAQGKRRIAIVGATGRREDHTIGNVSLLVEYARMGAEVCSFTDYGVFVPCSDTTTHRCRKGQVLTSVQRMDRPWSAWLRNCACTPQRSFTTVWVSAGSSKCCPANRRSLISSNVIGAAPFLVFLQRYGVLLR